MRRMRAARSFGVMRAQDALIAALSFGLFLPGPRWPFTFPSTFAATDVALDATAVVNELTRCVMESTSPSTAADRCLALLRGRAMGDGSNRGELGEGRRYPPTDSMPSP